MFRDVRMGVCECRVRIDNAAVHNSFGIALLCVVKFCFRLENKRQEHIVGVVRVDCRAYYECLRFSALGSEGSDGY